MVLPVSGFLPVPLPMMIPFMGAQSLVIGKMFGEGFQYGKRKISAMPNEEFNALTFEKMMSNARDEMQASIPTMIQAMQDMKPMVAAVIHEFTNYLKLVIEAAPEEVGGVIDVAAHAIAPHGTNIHTDEQNIFESIAEQFPHIHEAGATDLVGAKIKIPLQSFEDTEAKRIEIQRLQTLKNDRLKAMLDVKRKRLALKVPLPSAILPVRKFKQAAGQSQRLELKKLRDQIVSFTKLIKLFNKNQQFNKSQNITKRLKVTRQNLANLLNRYRF